MVLTDELAERVERVAAERVEPDALARELIESQLPARGQPAAGSRSSAWDIPDSTI